jgi:hypothetical protein
VFNVLAGGRVKHWAPEPNSFATHIACGVLAPEVVAAQLGSLTSTTPSAAGHQCGWSTKNGSGNSVTLTFPVVESAADLGVPAGTPTEPVAGRESWVATTDDGCAVYTRHIEFEPGAGTFEFAALAVTMRGDACGVARALASSAWQNLPPFS